MKQDLIKWLVQSITGLVFTGAGLSVCIDAGLEKLQGHSWFWSGTIGLIIFQTGLCLMMERMTYQRLKTIS